MKVSTHNNNVSIIKFDVTQICFKTRYHIQTVLTLLILLSLYVQNTAYILNRIQALVIKHVA